MDIIRDLGTYTLRANEVNLYTGKYANIMSIFLFKIQVFLDL